MTEGGRSPREVVAFRDVRRTLRGRRVVLGGPGPVADLLQQVGTHGEVAVPRKGDDPAQPRDWVVRQGDELVVPLEDLSPIGFLGPWRIIVQRGDRGLQLVLAASVRNKGLLEDPDALGDLVGVPQGAVLSVERDDATVLAETRAATSVVQEHLVQQARSQVAG